MTRDFSRFDEFKKDLGKRWATVSVYSITEMQNLLFDSFKPFIYALMNKGLDVSPYLDSVLKQVKGFYLSFKITENSKETEEKPNGTLKKYIEGVL